MSGAQLAGTLFEDLLAGVNQRRGLAGGVRKIQAYQRRGGA
jgi:hypothetical protein